MTMPTKDYAHPWILVSTEWADQHRNDPNVRIVEVDVDTKAYEEAHIPGAVGWNWQTQLCDTLRRDLIPRSELEKLLASSGIDNATTILLYGDNNNWFACWAFWQLKVYGHADVRIIDGGRKKWLAEGRPVSTDIPTFEKKIYRANEPDFSIRAFLGDVSSIIEKKRKWALVDVRSPDEFTGKILSPPGLPETCQRGGHIPGAFNIPWGKNCNEDGTFKSAAELRSLYEEYGITPDKNVVAYCRIGERSSLTWFALKYLLGYKNVKNYDGSWTEWGNLVNAPIARGDAV
jgi:thiosulfate/3-mercaptopyruvate sulfurtransferase